MPEGTGEDGEESRECLKVQGKMGEERRECLKVQDKMGRKMGNEGRSVCREEEWEW